MAKRIIKSTLWLALLLVTLDNLADSHTATSIPLAQTLKPRIAKLFDETKAAALGQTARDSGGLTLPSHATFFAQLNAGDVTSAGGKLPNNPAINILGRIHVAPEDVGQSAEILFVVRYNNNWYMKTPQGWQPWDLQLQHLVAIGAARTLLAIEDLEIESQLSLAGDFNVYLGYRRQGVSQYAQNPLNFSVSTFSPPAVLLGKLNDTGITACANKTTNDLPCPQTTHPGQDAQSGQDVTYNDSSDGHAGFSFTKVSSTGASLAASVSSWTCVKDNVTGLMWEVKTDDNGLHNKDWSYTWYEPDNSKNAGFAGYPNGGKCGGTSQCDTYAYVQAVNAAGWCGYNDWRMPTDDELFGIAVLDGRRPSIDTAYFPNTLSTAFWSSSLHASDSNIAWSVGFNGLGSTTNYKDYDFRVWLVRIGR
ncbi:MAG: DUF1566 domain-containing protein [Methylococcaceae bacterium]